MTQEQKAIYAHLLASGAAQTPELRSIFGAGLSETKFRSRLQYMSRLGLIRNTAAQNEVGRWFAIEQVTPPAARPLPARRYEVMRAPLLVAPVMCAARGVSA